MLDRRLETLDLNLLLALHWLLTERSVTAAAQRLGLSQPAASRALQKLRGVFGDPVLVKSGGAMAPTPLGLSLQPVVAQAVAQCRDVLRVSEPFDPKVETGTFTVACADFTGVIVSHAWAQSVAKEAPGIALEIITPTFESARDLVTGQLDICLIPGRALLALPPTIRVEDFVMRPVVADRLVVAVRRDHALAGKPITKDDYCAGEHIVVAPEGLRSHFIDDAVEAAGGTRRVTYRTDSFLLALSILLHTDCILTAPAELMMLLPDKVWACEPPFAIPAQDMQGTWHPNWTQNARHRWIRERLFEAMAQTAQALVTKGL